MKVRNLLEPCRREFQLRNCGFNHKPADELVRSQWQSRTKSVFYLIYRWLVAAFFLSAVTVSMSHIQTAYDFGMYMIYLTNWGILACLITGLFGAILVSVWYFHPEYSDAITTQNEMPAVFKVYWAFHNATLTLSFVITIIYWAILHRNTKSLDATNVLTHACNSAFMFLDVLIAAHPIRLYHVYQPLTIGLAFLIFSGIFYAAGGTDRAGHPYIYFVLDWSNPDGAIVTAVGTVVLAIVVHTCLFIVYKLREFIHDNCTRKNIVLPTTHTTAAPANISMVLGSGYTNSGFSKGSSDVL